ncbi:uncharacterized protein NEMAJ01_1080 [Nematocida major]|uniref:uncharacterized protein n=1 Tax=Nematocida major TaxID=1912982 RepID=UPI002008E626|nr:uncharacterized protein NEMAJ01_1080 [Nematocida major]KAH9386184.1 hypothetical protein NEMAJ01_1080 [Nematocida major]
MEAFVGELKTLDRILYKSKNAHRSTLYYRKAVHVQRALRKYVSESAASKKKKILLDDAQERCKEAYILMSSSIPLGHNIGLAIGLMATVARLFSLSKALTGRSAEGLASYVVECPDESTERDEISDIFK